jgi:hypothetical protein
MTNLGRVLFAGMAPLALWSAMAISALADTLPGGSSQDIVAFCREHQTLDDPGMTFFGSKYAPGMLPKQVEDVEASNWRCMDGAVLMCSDSADGDSCSKKDPSRKPSRTIRETCAEYPGMNSVTRAATAYSSSTWRCDGGKPVIIETYALDRRGFMKVMWMHYVVSNGVVVEPHDLDFPDPR